MWRKNPAVGRRSVAAVVGLPHFSPLEYRRRGFFEQLEPRTLFAAFTGDPLPTQLGQEFVLNDWDQVFLPSHLGVNYFSGATGVAQPTPG